MPDPETTPPQLNDLVTTLVSGLTGPLVMKALEKVHTNSTAAGTVEAAGAIRNAEIKTIEGIGELVKGIEKAVAPFLAPILTGLVGHMLGIEVSEDALMNAGGDPTANPVGRAVADTVLNGLTPTGTDLEPGDEGARRLMAMVTTLVVNSWAEGLVLSESLGASQALKALESFSELGDRLVQSLGISRLMRVALKPLVDETVATPLRWKINNVYRPSRLAPGQIVKQVARKRMTRDQGVAELGREGYTDDRIEALLNDAAKFLSLDDAMLLARNGQWTIDQIITDFGNQGYDEPTTRALLLAFREKRLLGIHDNIIATATAAYRSQDIDEPALRKIIGEVVPDADELQAYMDVAGLAREIRVADLSHAEVQEAVIDEILAFTDYRAWLDRNSYPPDRALTLELLLHRKKDKGADLEAQRKQILAERALAALDKQAAAVAKKAEVDAQRALARRGAAADLERAAVRGLISFDRVREVLAPSFDPDTVDIYLALLEAQRQDYLDTQAKAAAAAQRAAARSIDVGQLTQAVLEGVLSIDDFTTQLRTLKFPDADVAILRDTTAAKLKDKQDAQQRQLEAQQRAAQKSIDLPRFELLVRRGHRTMDDYAQLLASLGYDAGSVAAMVDLLNLKIADDAQARAIAAAKAADTTEKPPTLADMHRGVVLGVVTRDAFQQYLLSHHYTADEQVILLAELDEAVSTADAARQKRTVITAAPASPQLPLTRIAQAARLGIVDPAVYQDELAARGYSADDIALEMDLLVTEIAAVQATRDKAAQLAAAQADHGLSLEQVRRAVLAGVADLTAYSTRALELGYSDADTRTLTGVLEQELGAAVDARARRPAVAATLKAAGVSLDDLDAAVRAGTSTIDTYQRTLEQAGIDPIDAELLAGVLSGELLSADAVMS